VRCVLLSVTAETQAFVRLAGALAWSQGTHVGHMWGHTAFLGSVWGRRTRGL